MPEITSRGPPPPRPWREADMPGAWKLPCRTVAIVTTTSASTIGDFPASVLLVFDRDPPDGDPGWPIAAPRETLFGARVLSGTCRDPVALSLCSGCSASSFPAPRHPLPPSASATQTPSSQSRRPSPRGSTRRQTCMALVRLAGPRPRIGLDARRVIAIGLCALADADADAG